MLDMDFEKKASTIVKSELLKKDVNFVELAKGLNDTFGLNETNVGIAQKIGRGKFSMSWFMQIMYVLNVDKIEFKDYFERDDKKS